MWGKEIANWAILSELLSNGHELKRLGVLFLDGESKECFNEGRLRYIDDSIEIEKAFLN